MGKLQKLTVIDADSIIWIIGWRYKDRKNIKLLENSVDKMVKSILVKTKADVYVGFYGSQEANKKKNFRKEFYPLYKAQRKSTPDWFNRLAPIIVARFKDKWNMSPVEGIEADDAVSVTVNKYKGLFDITVASADKDLKTIPNIVFFDFKKNTFEKVDEFSSSKYFYTQMLTGDSADNIKGAHNVGKIKAKKILQDCTSVYSLFRKTCYTYAKSKKDEEEKIINKYKTSILEEVKKDNINLSTPKINRIVRLKLKDKLKQESTVMGTYTWKEWFKINFKLLKLLDTYDGELTIPDPVEFQKVNKINTDFLYDNI